MSIAPPFLRALGAALVNVALVAHPATIVDAQTAPVLHAAQSYTHAQLLTGLPDDTPLTFRGKATTLGVLRAAHERRLQRFAAAAALGRKLASDLHAQETTQLGSGATGKPGLATDHLGHPAATSAPASTPLPAPALHPLVAVPPVANALAGKWPIPQDEAMMCAATGATACISYPANTLLDSLSIMPGFLLEFDPLILPQECTAEGGVATASGSDNACLFAYASGYLGNFDPGDVAAGLPQFVQSCPGITITTDVKGAIKMQLPGSGSFTTGATAPCIVTALVHS